MQVYGQFCPIARALDVLGSRWTLLIVRDLLCYEIRGFNELARGLPRMSRALLSRRLRELQESGVVERRDAEPKCNAGRTANYGLTTAGQELAPVLLELLNWGAKWTFQPPREDELDPVLLMWWMRRRVRTENLPDGRSVAQFDFRGHYESYWLVLDRSDVSVCLKRPKFDIDVWIDCDLDGFYQVWLGQLGFREAENRGVLQLTATPELEREFPDWFLWSPATDFLGTPA